MKGEQSRNGRTKGSICYARVSTEQQAESGHGISAQIHRGRAYAEAMGHLPAEAIVDEGVSGAVRPDARPGLGRALAMLDAGEASVLITASLSRLGRRVYDVLAIADRAHQNGWSLCILDMALDTSTPTGRFTLVILAGVAELEREQIRERTRQALAAAHAKGVRLGRPVAASTLCAGERAAALRRDGHTWRAVAASLGAEGFRTGPGGCYTAASARLACLHWQADTDDRSSEEKALGTPTA